MGDTVKRGHHNGSALVLGMRWKGQVRLEKQKKRERSIDSLPSPCTGVVCGLVGSDCWVSGLSQSNESGEGG